MISLRIQLEWIYCFPDYCLVNDSFAVNPNKLLWLTCITTYMCNMYVQDVLLNVAEIRELSAIDPRKLTQPHRPVFNVQALLFCQKVE